jgi:tetratricopeptide (TPR) repeat protein
MKRILCASAILLGLATALFASYDEALKLYMDKQYKDSLAKIATELVVERDFEPNSPNYEQRYLAAHNHWKLGNFDNAILHLKKCAEIQKDILDPQIDIALIFIDAKRFRDAEASALKALTIQKHPLVYFLLGKANYGMGNYQKAKEFYEKAISLNPELYIAYNGLGMTLIKINRYSNANIAFAAAEAIAPASSEILNNLGLSFEYLGKDDDALTCYQKAAEKSPENPVIQQNYARLKDKKR